MMIQNETDVLDPAVRKALIESWNDHEAQCRKYEAFKAFECLNDHTDLYVLDLLMKQFDYETVVEMQYALTDISVFRKVISKLAKVYSNGVKRSTGEEGSTQELEEAAKYLDMDTAMQDCNYYLRAIRNTIVYVKPVETEEGGKFDIEIEVKLPFHYDPIISSKNPKRAIGYVLSDYAPIRKNLYYNGDAAYAGRDADSKTGTVRELGPPAMPYNVDGDKRQYIWWTKNFHFTTNSAGELLSTEDMANPIGKIPFVDISGKKSNGYWSDGGKDLVDTSIKINAQLTNLLAIGTNQGHGQLYMTGEALPKSIKVGPQHCLQVEHTKDQSTPNIGFLNANPQLAELRSNVEMLVALMLSTNNLSTSGFSTSLQGGGKDFASGIALIIDKSESVEDVQEQAKIFIKKEPEVWDVAASWFEVYDSKGLLTEEASEVEIPADIKETLTLQFPSPKLVMTEKEQLEVLKMRDEMGFNTKVELIMRDDPSLTTEQAEKKLLKIEAEKAARMETFAGGNLNGNQGDQSSGQQDQNGNQPGVPAGSRSAGPDQEANQA